MFDCIPMRDRSLNARDDLMHTLLEQPWNSGTEAWRTRNYRLRQPSTCHVRLRHGDKLCVERDNPLPQLVPASTTTVVCTVCARSTPIDIRCSLRGHSSHDEHPWVKNCPSDAALTAKQNTLQRDVTRCARATKFSRAFPPACAWRFLVVLLTHWETLRYRVTIRTNRRSTTLHNTRTRLQRVDICGCWLLAVGCWLLAVGCWSVGRLVGW